MPVWVSRAWCTWWLKKHALNKSVFHREEQMARQRPKPRTHPGGATGPSRSGWAPGTGCRLNTLRLTQGNHGLTAAPLPHFPLPPRVNAKIPSLRMDGGPITETGVRAEEWRCSGGGGGVDDGCRAQNGPEARMPVDVQAEVWGSSQPASGRYWPLSSLFSGKPRRSHCVQAPLPGPSTAWSPGKLWDNESTS